MKNKSYKSKILHRLLIADGHLKKVIKMVREDRYCIDVIHQSLAIQAALRKTDRIVMDNHMRSCVADAIKKGKKDEVVTEVMRVMEKM